MSARILIVEDEAPLRWSLRQACELRGFTVVEADTAGAALDAFDADVFDVILLDYRLPDASGVDVLRAVRQVDQDTVVIVMTGYGTIETAVEAIKLGAFNFVAKPFQTPQLLAIVDKALETTHLKREVRALRRQMQTDHGVETIIGRSPAMTDLLDVLRRVARAGVSTVLLRGETGTGKDLIARVVHYSSARAEKPFVNITCTALSETLLESELFGHERGAFTDAKFQKKGLLELADGGSAFLDEIGDMPAALQAKLLRFLEERCFRRVGGADEVRVDVRIIAATNRDLEAAIDSGQFRRDLLYRLNVVTLHVPPLRERGDDIDLLAQHFLARFSAEFRRPISGVTDAARRKLRSYDWPGNVRELRNVVERAVLLCKGDVIDLDDIVLPRAEQHTNGAGPGLEHFTLPPEGFDLAVLARLELNLLRQALARTDNNQSHAARLLNISRDRLRYRLQRHGLL